MFADLAYPWLDASVMSEYEEQRRDWRKRAGIVAYLIPKNWYMGVVIDDRQCSIPQKVVSRPR